MIDTILRIIEKLVDYFTKKDEPDEHTEGLEDFGELKKSDPDDPTMFVRLRRKK